MEKDVSKDTFSEYADPHEPLGYEAWTVDYSQPEWKDTKGRFERSLPKDYGTGRLRHQQVYFSKDIADREFDRLFAKTWHLVGHISSVPKKNNFMKVEIGHESILVVRGAGQKLVAFYNVCQHRGATLVEADFGSTKKLVCPFHRWEFGMDGKLQKISDRETFRKAALCHDLNIPKVSVANWRGWIFINMDDDPMPIDEWIGDELAALVEAYDFEKAVRVREIKQEWPVNWKIAHEAFNEGYHVQATHPQLHAAVNSYHCQHDLYANGHGRSIYNFMIPTPHMKNPPQELPGEMQIFLREAGVKEKDFPKLLADVPAAIIKAKKSRKNYSIDYSKFSEGQLIDDWGVGFFPSTETFLHPEGFFVQHWRPHPSGDPLKCIYHAQVYAIPGISELPSFTGVEGKVDMTGKVVIPIEYLDPEDIKGTGPVISQDRVVTPRTQKGVRSRGFKGAVLSDQEIRIRQWYDEYYKYMHGNY